MAAAGGKAHPLRSTCMRAMIEYGAPGGLSRAGAFLERCGATQRLQGSSPRRESGVWRRSRRGALHASA